MSARSTPSPKAAQMKNTGQTKKPVQPIEPGLTKEPTLSMEAAESQEPKDEPSIGRLGQIELIAKITTGIVALTYMSGYLIETTYLGTFGINADSIEFFRAKYLYIGFHYWFFLVIFSILLILCKSYADFVRASQAYERTQQYSNHIEGLELEDLENVDAKMIPKRKEQPASFSDLRFTIVVSAIVVFFSVHIMFSGPEEFRAFLPLQFMFLFFIAVQQATHFQLDSSHSNLGNHFKTGHTLSLQNRPTE
ncbi:MAG: hypothetical protein ABSC77_15240 [Terracidiphilus sp.]|jgi:hypothetical protein